MSRERLLQVSSKGGKNVPAEKRGFSNIETAKKAGKIGGKRLLQKSFGSRLVDDSKSKE